MARLAMACMLVCLQAGNLKAITLAAGCCCPQSNDCVHGTAGRTQPYTPSSMTACMGVHALDCLQERLNPRRS